MQTQERVREISKPEDYIIRQWIKQVHGIKVPQWALWKMTPGEAVDYLKEINRVSFSKLTEADIIRAARRE